MVIDGGSRMTYVYLLHFADDLERKRHYLGSCGDLDRRMKEHAAGRGAVLTRRFHKAGIAFVLARTWEFETNVDARKAEFKLKRGGASGRCPACKDERTAESA
jgi:predicted GIY-YIG superfamily endonuclease